MKMPRGSLRWVAERLRIWQRVSLVYAVVVGALLPASRESVVLLLVWAVLALPMALVPMHAWGMKLPAWLRWIPSNWASRNRRRRKLGQPLDPARREAPATGFEVDLPCERCGAHNIGQEAGVWKGGRVFRTCDTCGHTQWWGRENRPPRVRRRLRPLRHQPPRDACPRCGYDLRGVPLRNEDRGSGKVVHVQQCPECGRAEIVVLERRKA